MRSPSSEKRRASRGKAAGKPALAKRSPSQQSPRGLARRPTWREKLADDKGLPKVGNVDGKSARWGTGTMVIPAPREVDALMQRIPRGKLVTIQELRQALARKHRVDFACPITTGIFAWISAHAAAEGAAEGIRKTTPYWRTLRTGGVLNEKYPGGVEGVRARLEAEGHDVIPKGKRWVVRDYEKRLVRKL